MTFHMTADRPDADAPPFDPDAAADRVRRDLDGRRWSHLDRPVCRPEFDAVAARLGAVDRCMEVVVSPDRERSQREARRNKLERPSIYQSTELGFHTDPPAADDRDGVDLLAFYCVAQDPVDGACLLVDLGRVEEDFTPEEVDALGRVEVAFSIMNAQGVDELRTRPLLTRQADGPALHYMPWGLRRPADPDLERLLRKFEGYLRDRPVLSIRLRPGEALFVDNRRMLHGRGPIAPDSPRCLLRVHLRCHPA